MAVSDQTLLILYLSRAITSVALDDLKAARDYIRLAAEHLAACCPCCGQPYHPEG